MFTQLIFTLSNFIQHTVKCEHSFGFISLNFEASFNITFYMNKVLIQISEIITGTIENSFDFSFIFFYFNHFKTIFKQSKLFNIIKNIFAKSLKFGNNLIINFFTFFNVLFSSDISKFIFNHNISLLLFSCIENFSNLFSLFQLVEKILKIW